MIRTLRSEVHLGSAHLNGIEEEPDLTGLPRLMYGSHWRDGAVAIGDYVRQSGNHQYDGDNQRDRLTAGIRKHELLKHEAHGEVTLRSAVAGRVFPSPAGLSAQERVPVACVGPVL